MLCKRVGRDEIPYVGIIYAIASGGKGVRKLPPYGADVWEKIQGVTETKEFTRQKLNVDS